MKDIQEFVQKQIETVTWRKVAIFASFVACFGVLALGFKLGGSVLANLLQDDLEKWLSAARDTPWALGVVVGIFVGLGLTGFPQFLLIAATAFVFGSLFGFVYAWIATMVSATLHFGLAKKLGNGLLQRYGGIKTNIFSQKVGERGIMASGFVRVIPSAPFIVVNCAAGVSHMPYWKFAIGTGLGTIPKTFIVAFMGGSFMTFIQSQDPKQLLMVIIFVGFWIALGFFAKSKFMTRVGSAGISASAANDSAPLDGDYAEKVAVLPETVHVGRKDGAPQKDPNENSEKSVSAKGTTGSASISSSAS